MGFTPLLQISIKIVIVCQEHRACDMSPACSSHITKMTKNCVSVWDMYQNGQLHWSHRLCRVCIGNLNRRRCLGEEMTAGPLMGLRWREHKGERPFSDGSHSVLSAESQHSLIAAQHNQGERSPIWWRSFECPGSYWLHSFTI